jgi:hypothetical protein
MYDSHCNYIRMSPRLFLVDTHWVAAYLCIYVGHIYLNCYIRELKLPHPYVRPTNMTVYMACGMMGLLDAWPNIKYLQVQHDCVFNLIP